MIYVFYGFGLQLLVQSGGAVFKSKVIALAAVEINGEISQTPLVGPCQAENAVLLPVRQIDGLSEGLSQQAAERSVGLPGGTKLLRRLGHQGSALRADSGKKLGTGEGETQRSVAAHGDAGYGSALASGADAIPALDVGHELLQKKIAVAERIVRRVDVETASSFGRDNEKIDDLVLAAKILDQAPSTGIEQRLFVLSQTMQEVENGIAALLCVAGVIVRRQLHTVVDGMLEDAAIYRVAVGPALCGGRQRKEDKKCEEEPEISVVALLHVRSSQSKDFNRKDRKDNAKIAETRNPVYS